jgi:hypothetical protein
MRGGFSPHGLAFQPYGPKRDNSARAMTGQRGWTTRPPYAADELAAGVCHFAETSAADRPLQNRAFDETILNDRQEV